MTARSLLLGLGACALALAGTPRAGAQTDRAWVGTVRVSGDWLTGLPTFRETLEGTVRFDYVDTDASGSEEFVATAANLTWSVSGTWEGCTYSGGPLPIVFDPSVGDTGELWVHSDGLYEGHVYLDLVAHLWDQVVVECPDEEPVRIPGRLATAFATGFNEFYVREEGTLLAETYSDFGGAGLETHTWRFTAPQTEAELVVEPAGYETWQPQGGPNEQERGNDIAVHARLQAPGGGPTTVEAERFTFELLDVSREPGVALNWPLSGNASAHDLQFEPALNPTHTVAGDGLSLQTPGGRTSTATVSSFDWGAWGAVRVTAHLPGGRTVIGTLEGRPELGEIPLPQRQPGSRIADAWKRQQSATGLADDSDAEGLPEGDGHGGDGLTLYEEYRGFLENGRHRSANPVRKDLFVFDEIGGVSKRGIALFAAATRLEVHHEFLPSEYDVTRVVNVNRGSGASLGSQHGVRMVSVPGAGDPRAYSVGGDHRPGTPGTILAVEIPSRLLPGGGVWDGQSEPGRVSFERYMASTIAHELGHSVNVWHHGQADLFDVAWRVRLDADGGFAHDAAGNLLVEEDGFGPIVVRDEAGVVRTPRLLRTDGLMRIGQMGVQGGQHSGDQRCFMRYDVATAYVSTSSPEGRYYGTFGEQATPGTTMCALRTGTGVNAPGREPQPRYGDASTDGCRHQICVNDR
ncbi:MAG TPA: hypothetical protein VGB53_00250, partial [Rubricoccaceae bacterium]